MDALHSIEFKPKPADVTRTQAWRATRRFIAKFDDTVCDDPIRHTDRLKGCLRSLLQALRKAPILCQPPRGGGGKDGLAEAFEDGGDAGQAGVDGVHAGEDGVEFFGDAFLLVFRKRAAKSP